MLVVFGTANETSTYGTPRGIQICELRPVQRITEQK